MSQSDLFIERATVIAPGLDGWSDFCRLVAARDLPGPQADWRARPGSLGARAMRRLSPQTLLAIAVAEQVRPARARDAAWVFASAFAEGETLKVILDALCTPEMAVRPLRFQNSVHNAASGQWTISDRIRNPVTSICGGGDTVGAGLLKATLQARLEDRPVGLVLFDAPLPAPLSASHRLSLPAGVGFAISPERTEGALARVSVSLRQARPSPAATGFCRQAQASANPVFAASALLERLAGIGAGPVAVGVNARACICLEVDLL